jgi:uncharacterized membrane protein
MESIVSAMERLAKSRFRTAMTDTLTFVTAIGSGLVAGVYFAFSSFVMPALRRTAPDTGLSAMQAINVAAPTPPFMLPFVGTAVLSVALAISSLLRLDETVARYELIGSALYLASFVITAAYHVPRNNGLATVEAGSEGASARWSRYVREWTTGNHVRTIAALAAAVVLTIAVRVG